MSDFLPLIYSPTGSLTAFVGYYALIAMCLYHGVLAYRMLLNFAHGEITWIVVHLELIPALVLGS